MFILTAIPVAGDGAATPPPSAPAPAPAATGTNGAAPAGRPGGGGNREAGGQTTNAIPTVVVGHGLAFAASGLRGSELFLRGWKYLYWQSGK